MVVSSGLYVITETPQLIKTGEVKPITSISGGEVLDSGPILSMGIKAHYNNTSDVYVGGNTPGNYPYSGHGLLLKAGGAANLTIDNFNKIYVSSAISGDMVTYAGVL